MSFKIRCLNIFTEKLRQDTLYIFLSKKKKKKKKTLAVFLSTVYSMFENLMSL